MALLQSAGIYGIDGGLSSLRTSEAIVGRVVPVADRVEVIGWDLLARWWLFVRFFKQMMRFICRLSELLTGVYSLVCRGAMGGWFMGHMDWARLWYVVKVCITNCAALSMSLVVVSVEVLRRSSVIWALSRAILMALSPTW